MEEILSYWDITDRYVAEHGAPICPYCGDEKFPIDDHGRFMCFCEGYKSTQTTTIPQVDTSGMTDEEKSSVPAHDTPTAAESDDLKSLTDGDFESPAFKAL